ncbi:hypothetical protein [Streptomyces griseoloalbus]|uniref:LigA protein n=1 Tax=Streptomyces griseoloalbus TaxID=67303 RepID=A0A7W8F9T3_9ACTN|nr:hypothetical protein [Streptomyces albaduncus]MBB5128463.1 hypothetical protein [Streptomyces albaduncus]GGW68075.1 hypothetical protein GCM10010340_52750 [Streptomyces albaduncus]
MTTTAPTLETLARQAADDLRAVREQWGDLLAAIERPPATEWPPRETRGFLDQLGTADHNEDDEQPTGPTVGRLPLTLREHPAPLNLDALDAALSVEAALFASCDALAERVQRPIRTWIGLCGSITQDDDDRTDPARWHLPTVRDIGPGNAASAGSRAHGLHWAAVWLEGRALDERHGDLFAPTPPPVLDALAGVAAHARRTVERALQRDGRRIALDTPCPWCAGQLTGHTRPGGEPVVTCATGEGCGAPVILDHGRRSWRGAELVGLWVAMEAAKEREQQRA